MIVFIRKRVLLFLTYLSIWLSLQQLKVTVLAKSSFIASPNLYAMPMSTDMSQVSQSSHVQCFSMGLFQFSLTCNIALILFLKCDFTKLRNLPLVILR